MKQERNKSLSNGWIDIHDEELMIAFGIHPQMLASKDSSVWTKTEQERKLLKKYRSEHKGKMHIGTPPKREIPVKAKMIVQLKKNKKFKHTTYSKVCYMDQIDDVLSSFYELDNRTKLPVNVVLKYSFNGKTYKPNERPFWR